MSGIRFASEEENLSVGSRPRPKKRRSSILKSPSRNALQDLDPNAEEPDAPNHAKKKRRSSRRVSFANTYQVQEFLTANQLQILEDTSTERDATQPESDAHLPDHNTPSSTDCVQELQSLQADISVGPGHCIRGLETLLSGPIKNQSDSHPEAIASESVIPHAYPQPREGAVQLPMIDETCELPAERKVESGAFETSDPNDPKTDRDWPELVGNHDSIAVGLVGPSYHCSLPVADSFSSSCHTSFSSGFASSVIYTDVRNSNIDLDDTANFELTLCREQFLAGLTDPGDPVYDPLRDLPIEKKDASSFLKSFTETEPANDNFGQPVHSILPTYADGDHFENQAPRLDSKEFLKSFMKSGNTPPSFPGPVSSASDNSCGSPEKRDAKCFLQSLFGNENWQRPVASEETCIFSQDETASEMDLTACVSAKQTDGGCKKKDASIFLKSLAESNSSDVFGQPGHSSYPGKLNEYCDDGQKTLVFSRSNEAASGMDLTTCAGGVLQFKGVSVTQSTHQDMTVRFGNQGNIGNMEFTQCIGGVQEQQEVQKPSSQMRSRAGRPLEDITQIFDGQTDGVEMDLTTCSNPQRANFSNHPHADSGDGQTRIFYPHDTTAAMEMTTCINNQTSLMKSGKQSARKLFSDNREQDAVQDKTRIFHHSDTTAAMEMTTCLAGQEHFEKLPSNSSVADSSSQLHPYTVAEETRIFHHDDITGAMEMTTCLDEKTSFNKLSKNSADPVLSSNFQSSDRAEKTKIFSYDDTTAALEMTTCLDGNTGFSKSSRKSAFIESETKNLPHVEVEETTVFHDNDATAAMEMTACLDGNGDFTKSCRKSFSLDSRNINQPLASVEETRIFHLDDATAAMEMTECLDEKTGFTKLVTSIQQATQPDGTAAPTSGHAGRPETTECFDEVFEEVFEEAKRKQLNNRRPDRLNSEPLKESAVYETSDKTHIFKTENTAGMDFTTCIGGVLLEPGPQEKPAVATQMSGLQMTDVVRHPGSEPEINREPSLTLPSVQQEDHTRNFTSDGSAGMEMTTCIGGMLLEDPKITDLMSSKKAIDNAQVFSQDEGAQMELTACVGFLKPLPSMVSLSSTRAQSTTRLDDTAKMEMTTCVGGIFPKLSVKSSQGDTTEQPGDHTKIFSSSDTADMDVTKCIGGLHLPSFVGRTQSINFNEHTKVFSSDDTAGMEMTTCIGGLLPKKSSEEAVADSTEVANSDHLLGMQMKSPSRETESVISSTTQQQYPLDQTRIFTSDSTTSMEITACIGGINGKATVQSTNELHLSQTTGGHPPDQTRVFAYGSAGKMELTTCIGGIDTRDLGQHSHEDPISHPSDSTRLFTHEETSKMELTNCIGVTEGKAMDVPRIMPPEKKASQESIDCQGTEVFLPSEQSLGHQDAVNEQFTDETEAMEVNRCGNQSPASRESLETSPLTDSDKPMTEEAEPTEHDSDTFTIETSPVSGATEPTTRRSGTYTLDKPACSSTVENPTADTIQQKDCSDYPTAATGIQNSPSEAGIAAAGDLNRWGSLDSADGIDSEQPVWVENTEDFAQLSAEAGVARLMMMEAMKDQTDSGSVYELPTFTQEGARGVVAPSLVPNIDEKESLAADNARNEMVSSSQLNLKADESSFLQECESHGSEANDQLKTFLTVPPPGRVSMQDFLEFVTLSMPKGRRSVLPCLPQTPSPQTQSDFMEDHFIIRPKKELYEWAVSHLSSSIEKMQEAVNEQEQRMSEDNPEIVTEVQCASPEKAAKLHEQIESLHKACTKMSRGSFQEWRLKMVGKTHQSFKKAETEMNDILATLSSSLDTLNKNTEELEKFKDGLDNTLTRLKSVEPPSEEQIKEFIDRRNQLDQRKREVEEMQKTKTALESESLSLKMEIKQCEKELADTREEEMLLSNQTTTEDALQETMIKLEDLHCLQEWRLRKHSQEELVFTFLEDSLVFTVKLGSAVDNGDGVTEKKIDCLCMESLLADDADVCAHLAHNLVQASLDMDMLHSRHPTTASLKMLLQEASEMVSQADSIADETDRIKYRHVVTLSGINPVVEFSSLDAMAKFWVTFNLLPRSYPFSAISADFRHKIGSLKQQDVQAVLSQVKPGWTYFSRLVQSIDTLIQQHIPSDDPTF